MRFTTRASISLLAMALLCSGCTKTNSQVVALLVAYQGPTDKVVPCLVLSDASHKQQAAAYAERFEHCPTFASIIEAADQREFFQKVAEIRDNHLQSRGSGPQHLRFVVMDDADGKADFSLDVARGLEVVSELLPYFPNAPRIEAEFIQRFPEARQ